MRKQSPATDQTSLRITTRNMADAVSYLRRVAIKAGLKETAIRLASIRTSLLKMSYGDQRKRKQSGQRTVNGGSHGNRMFN
jgi:hypothetical protein